MLLLGKHCAAGTAEADAVVVGIRMSSWSDKLISGRMLMSGKDHWKHYCEILARNSVNQRIKYGKEISLLKNELGTNLLMVDSILYSKLPDFGKGVVR